VLFIGSLFTVCQRLCQLGLYVGYQLFSFYAILANCPLVDNLCSTTDKCIGRWKTAKEGMDEQKKTATESGFFSING
jgi:hypothetical protein